MSIDVELEYSKRFSEVLVPLAEMLVEKLTDDIGEIERIDRISARAKEVDKFVAKSQKTENGTNYLIARVAMKVSMKFDKRSSFS